MIQNTVDVIYITNIRHQKWKDNVKGRFIFIVFTDTVIDALIVKKQQYDYFMGASFKH